LDKAYKAHRWVGESAFFLIFLHPIFLALDPKYNFFSFFWIDYLPEEELHSYIARLSGIAALFIFILLVAFSLWIPMRYHRWKQTHNFFGLLLVLVIFHGIVAQGEIMSYPFLLVWFGLWVTMGLLGFLYIRLLYRWFGPLHEYIVQNVVQFGDIIEIYLQSRRPYRKLMHRPGQFIYIYFDLNVLGLLLACQTAVKHFNLAGGSIVNISSLASKSWAPYTTVYSATKAAVDSITKSLGCELGPRNIRVNAINPGIIQTEGTQSAGIINSELRQKVEARTPR